MKNYTPARLYQGQPLTTENKLTLTPFSAELVPSSTKVIIKQVVIANTKNTASKIALSLVASGGNAGNENRILPDMDIEANTSVVVDLSQVMEAGDFLSAKQGTAGAVTITISGVVIA